MTRDAVTAEEDNDLEGLPRVIHATLVAHPGVARRGDGKAICAGDACEWVKPGGKSVTQGFRNHQTFELQWAIGQWYDGS